MDFFEDDASGRSPATTSSGQSGRQRRRSDPRRTRIYRLAILAAVLFVVVFGLAWWARSCQHNRKVDTYRGYFDGVSTAITDSADLGKQFNAIVDNPTKLSRKELIDKLGQLAASQDEIAARTARMSPPGTLKSEQSVFSEGMRVRANGFALLKEAMLAALANKKVGPARIAALDGYFAGPDAYYMDLVYLPSRTVLSDEGVTDVAVPTSTYYLTWSALDLAHLQSMLARVGSSAKLSGIHGVGLTAVTARTSSGDIQLDKTKSNNVPASADLSFVVSVQNQGSVAENNVPVTVTLLLPGGSTIQKEGSIATIAPNQSQDVTVTGFAIPPEALSKEVTLKVLAGPVPSERVISNNKGQYKLVLQLK